MLDLFATTRPDLVNLVSISDPVSDHCLVSTYMALSVPVHDRCRKQRSLVIPDFARADWDGLRSALLMAPLLEAMQGTKDVDATWAAWYSVFTTVNLFVPMRLIMIRKGNKFWMTTELRRLVRRKNRLFKAACRSGTDTSWNIYRQARNRCVAGLKKAKNA